MGTLERHHPSRAAPRVLPCGLTPGLRRRPFDRRPIQWMLPHATRSPGSAAFRRRRLGRPTRPEPLFHHPRKGMMQPRLGTPSTVSADRLLSPAARNALHSELNTEAPRTPFHQSFGHGPHQRGVSVEALAIVWLSSHALRRCPCPTRDACDRFLPSAASISSTRASFAPDEVTASPERTLTVRPGRRR